MLILPPKKILFHIIISVVFALLVQCQTARTKPFRKIIPPKDSSLGVLYLYRPYEATLSFWDAKLRLTAQNGLFCKDYLLEVGEFKRIPLAPGVYKVALSGFVDRFLIIRIEPKKIKYIAVLIHATSFWSKADFILARHSQKEALFHLLAGNRMYQKTD